MAGLVALATPLFAGQDPVGIWNIKIRVGKIGEGVRPILLKVERTEGGFTAKITGLRHDFQEVSGFKFEKDTMIVEHGAYTYTMKVEGDTLSGTVMSPGGSQEISGARQQSVLYVGDSPKPLRKAWTGVVADRHQGGKPYSEEDPAALIKSRIKSPQDWVLVARGVVIEFTNAGAHQEALMEFAGKTVRVTGTWRTDKIEIEKIEPAPPRR